MRPLLSIIVPTHNRAIYAVPTVSTLLGISASIQVVVSDTSEESGVAAAFAGVQSTGELLIVRPKTGLSIVDNFRAALAAASGHYLLFIGDDDLVHPGVLDVVRMAEEQGVDAVRCAFPASYYWPDFVSRYYGDGYAGKLAIRKCTGQWMSEDPNLAYRSALGHLGAGVMQMPRAYLGIVSRRLVERIEADVGSIFGGVSPDIYSAALIARSAARCVTVDFPFVVPGSGGGSGSGRGASGLHKGGLRDNPHIAAFPDLQWDARIPEFYSVETVWGFSLLKAAECFGEDALADFGRLYARCLFLHPDRWREILRSLRYSAAKQGRVVILRQFAAALVAESSVIVGRVFRKLSGRAAASGDIVVSNVADSRAATVALQSALIGAGISLASPEHFVLRD